MFPLCFLFCRNAQRSAVPKRISNSNVITRSTNASVSQNEHQTQPENSDAALTQKSNFFKRSNTVATPHQRYRGFSDKLNSESETSEANVEKRQSRLRRYDLSHLRRSSLAKPSPDELIKLYEQDATRKPIAEVKEPQVNTPTDMDVNSKAPKSLQAQVENLAATHTKHEVSKATHCNCEETITEKDDVAVASHPVLQVNESSVGGGSASATPRQRRKRLGVMRTHSLRGGLWGDYGGSGEASTEQFGRDIDHDTSGVQLRTLEARNQVKRPSSMLVSSSTSEIEKETTKDDLETSLNRFMLLERERVFERTQMRRSYMRLPRQDSLPARNDSDDSDSESNLRQSDRAITSQIRRRTTHIGSSPLVSKSDTQMSSNNFSGQFYSQDTDLYSAQATMALETNCDVVDQPKRHDDIRERIRRYKASTSHEEEPSSSRRSSTCSSVPDQFVKRKGN